MTDRHMAVPPLLVQAMEKHGITALEAHHLKHIHFRGDVPRSTDAWFAIAKVARVTVWDKLDPSEDDWYLLYTIIKAVCTPPFTPRERPRYQRKAKRGDAATNSVDA